MDYDPSKFCAEHCPGGPPTDQPCLGEGHAPSSQCESCVRLAQMRQGREERQVFIAIEKRRNDPEFMGRLQRHIEENRPALDRLAER